ncbi:MAG TPA: ABC transporter transmembrane domain-containing protein, partial [Ilumatobacteraceae bacterium]|nr:ABC transporter transmembrane domain-containing protein [Ilumatobacteraceae bacterium]
RDERRRFNAVNDGVTDVAMRAGRLMAFFFPIVVVVLNVSSVAAVWIGADRISDGKMTVGAMMAFLVYLAQILMSVMMGSFIAVLIPRAAVCAER